MIRVANWREHTDEFPFASPHHLTLFILEEDFVKTGMAESLASKPACRQFQNEQE